MSVRLKKSRVPNLYRAENGHYYMRAMVDRKPKKMLLRTADGSAVKNFDLAKIILNNELAALGAKNEQSPLAWGNVCDDYLKKYSSRPDLTEKTIKDKAYEMGFVKKAFKNMEVGSITGAHVAKWWTKFCAEKRENGKERSARTKNIVLDTVQAVFRYAETAGVIAHAPRADVKRLHIPKTLKTLSPIDEFRAIIAEMRDGYKRALNLKDDDFFCHSADMVEFMAYSGCRHEEARLLLRKDIQAHGVIIHGVKRGGDRFIDFNKGLREVCERLIQFHTEMKRKENDPIFMIKSPRIAFERATKAVGAPHCTMHGLRHFFITSCIEAGILPATVAGWVGHKDGGLLIAKTYTHIRNDHTRAEAAKLDF